MPYRLVEIDPGQPAKALQLSPAEDGVGVIARCSSGRLLGFTMCPLPRGSLLSEPAFQNIIDSHFALPMLEASTESALLRGSGAMEPARTPPSLTVAICTKDRPDRLRRLLASLQPACAKSRFAALEIVVVDNASVDDRTREAAAAFEGVRYVHEPKTGLDFARNAALHAANGDLLAFLDDDVVVDRCWIQGLFRVWSDCPDAGGYTGLVLPFRLDTEAQIEFESAGGFGRGFRRTFHDAAAFANPLHPVGAGVVGAGCNMCFDRRLLLQLGGFDDALDTGAPLPGGGDLDIFYRVMRSGRGIVYEPQYAVYHEHRETLPQLTRQYWSWGLGFMAFLAKCRRTDPELHARHGAMTRWWFINQIRTLVATLGRRQFRRAGFLFAELRGGVQGIWGEYDRSLRRTRRIREQVHMEARASLGQPPANATRG